MMVKATQPGKKPARGGRRYAMTTDAIMPSEGERSLLTQLTDLLRRNTEHLR